MSFAPACGFFLSGRKKNGVQFQFRTHIEGGRSDGKKLDIKALPSLQWGQKKTLGCPFLCCGKTEDGDNLCQGAWVFPVAYSRPLWWSPFFSCFFEQPAFPRRAKNTSCQKSAVHVKGGL